MAGYPPNQGPHGGQPYPQQPQYPQQQPQQPQQPPYGQPYPQQAPYGQQPYGAPPQPYYRPGGPIPQAGYMPQPDYSNMGVTPPIVIWGFVLSLLGCTSWPGLIMCAIGYAETKKRQAGTGLAMAGIVIGAVWQFLGLLLWALGTAAEAGAF
jgi:hypothetical protein